MQCDIQERVLENRKMYKEQWKNWGKPSTVCSWVDGIVAMLISCSGICTMVL